MRHSKNVGDSRRNKCKARADVVTSNNTKKVDCMLNVKYFCRCFCEASCRNPMDLLSIQRSVMVITVYCVRRH
jgi:hypothetical protein